jgi:hypothetical protein
MAWFLPDANGEVACIGCRKTDRVTRRGVNELVGCEPEGGQRLYIHHDELMRMDHRDFEVLHAIRSTQAFKGFAADEVEV